MINLYIKCKIFSIEYIYAFIVFRFHLLSLNEAILQQDYQLKTVQGFCCDIQYTKNCQYI